MKRSWLLIGSSDHMYHPRMSGTLREAVDAAAKRSLDYCVRVSVFTGSRGLGREREVALIGKPHGCTARVSRYMGRTDRENTAPEPGQRLVKDAKKSTTKRIVMRWER